jgi:effector-binding domain-containing protein
MGYEVQVKTVTTQPIAVVRRQVSREGLSKAVTDACGTTWSFARANKIPAGRHIAVYLDGAITLEAGVEVHAPFAGSGTIVSSGTPAGSVATTVHFGPYNQLGRAHSAILQWCADHGRRLAGPNWEIYGHWVDEWNSDPPKIRTDVFYLLEGGPSALI